MPRRCQRRFAQLARPRTPSWIAIARLPRICFDSLPAVTPAPVEPTCPRRNESAMTTSPMQALATALRRNGLIRFIETYAEQCPSGHLKDLVVEELGPGRTM